MAPPQLINVMPPILAALSLISLLPGSYYVLGRWFKTYILGSWIFHCISIHTWELYLKYGLPNNPLRNKSVTLKDHTYVAKSEILKLKQQKNKTESKSKVVFLFCFLFFPIWLVAPNFQIFTSSIQTCPITSEGKKRPPKCMMENWKRSFKDNVIKGDKDDSRHKSGHNVFWTHSIIKIKFYFVSGLKWIRGQDLLL